MRGVEFETTLVVLPGLLVSLDGAYLDAKVIECLDITGKNVANLYPFPSAPPAPLRSASVWGFVVTS